MSVFLSASRWCSTPVRVLRSWGSTASWKMPRCPSPRSESTPCPASRSTTRDPKQRCPVSPSSNRTCLRPSVFSFNMSSFLIRPLCFQIAPQTSTITLKRRRRATHQNRKAATTPFMDRWVWTNSNSSCWLISWLLSPLVRQYGNFGRQMNNAVTFVPRVRVTLICYTEKYLISCLLSL